MSPWLFKYCICLLLETVFAFVFVFVLLQGKLHTQSYANRKHHVTLIIQGLYLSFPWNSICIHNSICIFFVGIHTRVCRQWKTNKKTSCHPDYSFVCICRKKIYPENKRNLENCLIGTLIEKNTNREKSLIGKKFDYFLPLVALSLQGAAYPALWVWQLW